MNIFLIAKIVIREVNRALTITFLILVCAMLGGCKKLIEVNAPSTSLSSLNVYKNDETAIGVVSNIYGEMSQQNSGLNPGTSDIAAISLFAGLGADELTLYDLNNQNLLSYYSNDLKATTSPNFFDDLYKRIFICNNVLEGLKDNTFISAGVRDQLVGECLFIRSFCYFYLVNLYGDVPLLLDTDWKANSVLKRSKTTMVYEQIEADLFEAKELLSEDFLSGTLQTLVPERVRPTKWAALALLCRVNLYTENWLSAVKYSTEILNESSRFQLSSSIADVFKSSSNEVIWSLQPVVTFPTRNTGEGRVFWLLPDGPNATDNPVYINSQLISVFENGDFRRMPFGWIDSVIVDNKVYHFPAKYKLDESSTIVGEFAVIFRLAEILLIRSEARAHLGEITESLLDLNMVRRRAGLIDFNTTETNTLYTAILKERQVELFTEWGHRWFDLKRLGLLDNQMEIVVPFKSNNLSWKPYQSLFPIPKSNIDRNPRLTQNAGY